mmetsp:Transcript_1475/g.3660  ORF Transcript_1475/g.3660 Transcript_1475/m.3660 type:complete len:90 (+) Transcript_1475:484-753(+)
MQSQRARQFNSCTRHRRTLRRFARSVTLLRAPGSAKHLFKENESMAIQHRNYLAEPFMDELAKRINQSINQSSIVSTLAGKKEGDENKN